MTMEIGRERMARMMSLRRLSPATQESYVREMARLVRFTGGLPPAKITERQVEDLLIEMRKSGRYADKSVNVAKCAMQFFYEHVTIRPEGMSGGPGRSLSPASHRSGRAGCCASGSSNHGLASGRQVE